MNQIWTPSWRTPSKIILNVEVTTGAQNFQGAKLGFWCSDYISWDSPKWLGGWSGPPRRVFDMVHPEGCVSAGWATTWLQQSVLMGLGIQEGENTVKLRSDLNFVWFQAPRDLLPVVHLPVQDHEVHPVAAVQVGGYPGHRVLRFAALPRDLHLRLPGMMGTGEDKGLADQGLRCSSRSLWLSNLCADTDGPSARGCKDPWWSLGNSLVEHNGSKKDHCVSGVC